MKRFLLAASAAAGLASAGPSVAAAQTAAQGQAPAGATAPRWGADDQIGAANHLTPEAARRAAGLVREGKVYGLAVEITPELRGPGGRQVIHTLLPSAGELAFIDDYAVGHLSVGTQIDGLGHGVVHGRSYNGVDALGNLGLNELKRLGVEHIPPIVARGVLLDIAALRGVPHLQAGDAITPEDIEGAMRRQGVSVGRGDVVLLHTGWMDAVGRQDPLRYVNTEPGLGVPGGEFLAARDVVAVGLDVAQMDPIARAGDYSRPVHEVLLTRNGIYCLENVVTGALARDRAYEFLFVANPVRYRGAAQAPLAPVAIR